MGSELSVRNYLLGAREEETIIEEPEPEVRRILVPGVRCSDALPTSFHCLWSQSAKVGRSANQMSSSACSLRRPQTASLIPQHCLPPTDCKWGTYTSTSALPWIPKHGHASLSSRSLGHRSLSVRKCSCQGRPTCGASSLRTAGNRRGCCLIRCSDYTSACIERRVSPSQLICGEHDSFSEKIVD